MPTVGDARSQPGSPAFCPACRRWSTGFRRDQAGTERACRHCRSLERHRVLAVLVPALAGRLTAAGARSGRPLVVDVAPTSSLAPTLAALSGTRVLRMDFDPAADGRDVDVQASVTAMPLADASVDLLVCSHVLEHVPDDAAAMAEVARVVAPGGLGLVVVPWRAGPTDEDPAASPAERVRRFGQADHVRYYGDDVEARLERAGLDVRRLVPQDLLPPWAVQASRLRPREPFWLVRGRSQLPLPDAATLADDVQAAYAARLTQAAATALADAVALGPVSRRALRAESLARGLRRRAGRLRPAPRR